MHISTLLVVAATATVSWAAAIPQPEVAEIDARAIDHAHTNFHITKFSGESIPHTAGSSKYEFNVRGTSDRKERRFEQTHCSADVFRSGPYQSLLKVKNRKCDNPNVSFDFIQYSEGEEIGGWQLNVRHKYTYQVDDQIATNHDEGFHQFPKSHIKMGGEGTSMYQYVAGPKDFVMRHLQHFGITP